MREIPCHSSTAVASCVAGGRPVALLTVVSWKPAAFSWDETFEAATVCERSPPASCTSRIWPSVPSVGAHFMPFSVGAVVGTTRGSTPSATVSSSVSGASGATTGRDLAKTGSDLPVGLLATLAGALIAGGTLLVVRRRKAQ